MKDFFTKHGDKALFALALAYAIAFLAAALLRGEGSWLSAEAPGIIFTQWWEGDLDKNTLGILAEEFEMLHEIKVNINHRTYDDLRRDIFTSAKTPPGDVIALDPLWVPELLEMEIIENDDFNLFSFIDVLYYNAEILKDLGFSRPPKNRSEFLDYARVVAGVRDNRPPFALAFSLGENNSRGVYDDVFPWIWAAGVQLIRDGSPVVNSRQVIEGLSFLVMLNNEGLIAPDAFRADAARKLEHFIAGDVAFMIAPTVYIRQVRERMGDEAFGITSVPAPDNYFGRPFLAAAGWAFGVHSASQRMEEARLFADFLARKAPFFSEQMGAAPGNGAPNSFVTPARDPFYSKVWDIAISGESARDFVGLPWTELEAVFREGLISLFTGKTSPAETAAAIQERWEAGIGSE